MNSSLFRTVLYVLSGGFKAEQSFRILNNDLLTDDRVQYAIEGLIQLSMYTKTQSTELSQRCYRKVVLVGYEGKLLRLQKPNKGRLCISGRACLSEKYQFLEGVGRHVTNVDSANCIRTFMLAS